MFSLYIVWYVFLAGLGAGAFLLANWQNAVNGNEDLAPGSAGRLSPYAAGFLVAPLAFLLACVRVIISGDCNALCESLLLAAGLSPRVSYAGLRPHRAALPPCTSPC